MRHQEIGKKNRDRIGNPETGERRDPQEKLDTRPPQNKQKAMKATPRLDFQNLAKPRTGQAKKRGSQGGRLMFTIAQNAWNCGAGGKKRE